MSERCKSAMAERLFAALRLVSPRIYFAKKNRTISREASGPVLSV